VENQKLKNFVKGAVKRQALKIIMCDTKKFNSYIIIYGAKKQFLKEDYDFNNFNFAVRHYYKLERNRLQKKYLRIKNNNKVKELINIYKPVDVSLLTYYLNLMEILNFKTPNHYKNLEQIIRIVLSLEKRENEETKFVNFKYIKEIKNRRDIVDVEHLACYLNEIKDFNFKSKLENEILENIIKIILSIPISTEYKIDLKPWQLEKHLAMKEIQILIEEQIKTNKNILLGKGKHK